MASTRSGDCLIAVAAVETNSTMLPPLTEIRLHDTHRLIPSRYPPIGILDAVAAPEDLELMFALEGWTNDRISAELGLIHAIPKDEWVIGKPQATVIMAAFCHPKPGGGRFNGENRGAWYAAFDLDTAHAEAIYHRTKELVEIGVLEMRLRCASMWQTSTLPFMMCAVRIRPCITIPTVTQNRRRSQDNSLMHGPMEFFTAVCDVQEVSASLASVRSS